MNTIINLVFQFRSTSYTTVAMITLWAYDYLCTLPDEIELVWQKSSVFWTKILFFANRNLPIIHAYFIGQFVLPTSMLASKLDCDVAVAMITICSFLQMLVAHIIFTMRIYTLSHAYPQFQIFVVAALVITQAASTVLAAFTIKEVLPSFTYYPQGDTCIYLTQANNIYSALMMILSVALETLIFVATIYYTVRYQRTLSVLEGARSISILKRLSLHGSQFFVLVILSHVSTILSLYFIPLGIQLLVPTFNYFFTSMLVSRFVLSLQREIFDSKNPEESGIQMTGPSIVLTRTPITFLYSEHRFGSDVDVGDDDDHGGGNGFGPETFTSMTSLGRFKQNEEPETDMEMRRFSKALGSRERIPNQ